MVLDREFSYLELLLELDAEQINFVIRLKLGIHPPKFYNSEGQEVHLTIVPSEPRFHQNVWYKDKACVNLIGIWGKGRIWRRYSGLFILLKQKRHLETGMACILKTALDSLKIIACLPVLTHV